MSYKPATQLIKGNSSGYNEVYSKAIKAREFRVKTEMLFPP